MPWLKKVADALTGLRLALSVTLAALGLTGRLEGPQTAAVIVLAAWTTDALDGPLARKSGQAGQNWWGQGDLLVDMALATALLIYMCSAGMAHPLLGLAHLLVWLVILVRQGSITKPLGAAFQGPIYVWFGVSLLMQGLLMGRVMLLWVLGNIAINWRRFAQRDVPRFIEGLGDLVRRPADGSTEEHE